MSRLEPTPLAFRLVEPYDSHVTQAAETIITNARAFYPAFSDTFGLYFESQPPELGESGAIATISSFISYELGARQGDNSPRADAIELPANFDEQSMQYLLGLASREDYAYRSGNSAERRPAEVFPEEARLMAFVGGQILSLNEQGLLGARQLTRERVSLLEHVVGIVNEFLPLQR
jgi:hypothetical protein